MSVAVPSGVTGGSLKSTLLRAWRERWPEERWSVNVKQCQPAQLSPDDAQLSDLLLQQALIGSSPNTRILSYLKYAVATQMVSYRAAMTSAMTYTDLEKPFCMAALLDLLGSFVCRVAAAGCSEDSVAVATTLLRLLSWLLSVLGRCLERLAESKPGHEVVEVADKCGAVMLRLLSDDANVALLQVARVAHPDVLKSIEAAETGARNWFKYKLMTPNDLRCRLETSLLALSRLTPDEAQSHAILDVSFHPLNASINVLITMEVLFKPTNQLAVLLGQVKVIQQLQGLSLSTVTCELLRSCMMGLVDSHDKPDMLRWLAFTFLKLPQLLVQLTQEMKLSSTEAAVWQTIEQGLDNLLDYVALLDLTDTKHNCDCLHFLLELFYKYSLISEAGYHKLTKRRQTETQRSAKMRDQAHSNPQKMPEKILQADVTVVNILRMLVIDAGKNQEEFLNVLSRILNLKSFELILTAAAATGRLESFAVKLVKFNEFVRVQRGAEGSEGENAAHIRALDFDTSFLMLCHIVQIYGVQLIAQNAEAAPLFFTQWAARWLPGEGHDVRLDDLPPPDPATVESLLRQFNPGGKQETSMVRWHDVVHNAPFAIQEVLNAWEHGALTSTNIEVMVMNVKRACSLPVVIGLWLRSYVSSVDSGIHAKPLQILALLSSPTATGSELRPDQHYAERAHLMHAVLSRLAPPPPPPDGGAPYQTVDALLKEVIVDKVLARGHMDIASAHKFHRLMALAGPQCLSEHLVKLLLAESRTEELNLTASVLFAIFLASDLPRHAAALFATALPAVITLDAQRLHLVADPRGTALARLCVMCLAALARTQPTSTHEESARGIKRSRSEVEAEDEGGASGGGDDPPNKLRRLPSNNDISVSMATGYNLTDMLSSKEDYTAVLSYDPNEPINMALVSLMRLFERTLVAADANPRSCFIASFFQQLVLAGDDVVKYIKQFMPVTMVAALVQCMPGKFEVKTLLRLSELSSVKGRMAASKVICRSAKYQRRCAATP